MSGVRGLWEDEQLRRRRAALLALAELKLRWRHNGGRVVKRQRSKGRTGEYRHWADPCWRLSEKGNRLQMFRLGRDSQDDGRMMRRMSANLDPFKTPRTSWWPGMVQGGK